MPSNDWFDAWIVIVFEKTKYRHVEYGAHEQSHAFGDETYEQANDVEQRESQEFMG